MKTDWKYISGDINVPMPNWGLLIVHGLLNVPCMTLEHYSSSLLVWLHFLIYSPKFHLVYIYATTVSHACFNTSKIYVLQIWIDSKVAQTQL